MELRNNKKNFYLYFAEALVLFFVIINCRGFRYLLPSYMQGLSIHIYKIITFTSVIYIFIKQKYVFPSKYIRIYFILYLIVFLAPEICFSIKNYHQGFGTFLLGYDGYFVIVWTFLYIYIYKKYGYRVTILFDNIANILFVGYLSLIINVFLQEKINVSLFNISVWNISKGHIRITDTSSFFGIITCYLWAQILNRRKILSNLIKLVVILSGFVYVDRSRMPLYSAILCIVFMALLYHKETISKVVSWIGVVAVSLIVLMLGIYKDILMQFSADNNGLSTLARINELEYYFLAFWDKPVYGLGIAQQRVFYDSLGIESFTNKNFEDIGIIGLLGVIGIIGVLFTFIIPVVRWIYIVYNLKSFLIKNKCYEFLVGVILYVVFTSMTYVIVNYQRIPALPLLVGFFEVIFCMSKRKWEL